MNNKEFKEEMNKVSVPQDTLDKIRSIPDSADTDDKIKKVSFTKSRTFKRIVSLAASFAIVIGLFSIVGANWNSVSKMLGFTSPETSETGTETGDALPASGVTTFKSEKELLKYIKKVSKDSDWLGYIRKNSAAVDYAVTAAGVPESVNEASATGKSITADGIYGKTYTQEEGVDEADIIKTFGNYIFYVYTSYDDDDGYPESKVEIFRVESGKETKVATVIPFTDHRLSLNDIYVTENRLIINATKHRMFRYFDYVYNDAVKDAIGGTTTAAAEDNKMKDDDIDKTITYIYDISDISSPKLLKEFKQSGYYVSSRMIGNVLYLISNYSIMSLEEDFFIPKVYSGDSSEKIKPENICRTDEDGAEQYVVASAIDTSSADRHGESKAIIGNGWSVYCSVNSLYVYDTNWEKERIKTEITKISLGENIQFVGSTTVNGNVDSQYSFSERNGYLFVCNTVTGKNGKESNVLRVLDKDLKEVAKTEYFAVEESIKAVKYIGNYAYVITYEETDPLFVIDISSPEEPKLLGHAYVSGFSTMLVDIGNNMLLGIGYCTGEYEGIDMEVTDGVKFTLFSVSDPLNPTVLDEKEFKDIYSEAQENPKAFVQNLEKGYYAITYSENYEDDILGALVVSVRDGKIVVEKDFKVDADGCWESRLTFVGDWYYLINENAGFSSFEMK